MIGMGGCIRERGILTVEDEKVVWGRQERKTLCLPEQESKYQEHGL